MRINKFLLFKLLFLSISQILFSQPTISKSSSEIYLDLRKSTVLGSVLYIAAHPDDENTGLLAYYSKGKNYRTAYLSLTRGDGGQNLIGSEKGDEIGIIRTYELLEARKIDGAQQFFTRAVDFGYSKSVEETLDFWNRDSVLSDMVWVIRKFRPDVIITRFPPEGFQTHGHHTSSALLAVEAFHAAGDSSRFPHQLKLAETWSPVRIYWNTWRPQVDTSLNKSDLITADVGEYNPMLGLSYSEMSALSRTKHKSQGFGTRGSRGSSLNYFQYLAGVPASKDLFDDIDVSWKRVKNGHVIDTLLQEALRKYNPEHPSVIIPLLVQAIKQMNHPGNDPWIAEKKQLIENLIQNCAGLWLEAISRDFSAAPGDSITIDFEAVNRSDINLMIKAVEIGGLDINIPVNKELYYNDPLEFSKTLIIPANSNFTKPFWLNEKPANNLFTIRDQSKRHLGENRENLTAKFTIEIDGIELEVPVRIMHRWVDRVSGENYRYLEIIPPVTANFSGGVYIFPNTDPKRIEVEIKSFKSNLKGTFRLSMPEDWKAEPEFSEFQISEKYEVIKKYFTITPPIAPEEGIVKGIIETETGEEYSFDYSLIEHAHIPKISYLKESELKLVRFNTGQVATNVGYIEGSGDEIPVALSQLGYNIVNLDPETLTSNELSRLDAVILGVRALNTNKGIGIQKEILMDYVNNGGTLIIQYNVSFGLAAENFGPYPYKIGRGRVTIENAPMKCLDKENSLMKFPNKITDIDFENWVQERGLYFAESWDNKYHPLFSCSDPGEEDLLGSLIYTKFGKGVFIYTGLSFFRQLPAGVSGAYRLFVNLISAGMYNGS